MNLYRIRSVLRLFTAKPLLTLTVILSLALASAPVAYSSRSWMHVFRTLSTMDMNGMYQVFMNIDHDNYEAISYLTMLSFAAKLPTSST